MLSGYVSVLSTRYFVPWRGGGRMGACQGPPGPRPVQAPRALTPLVARSTPLCRRLRPRFLLFRQLLPLRKAQPAPPVSIRESAHTLPTSSHIHRALAALGAPASLTLAPALGRAVVSVSRYLLASVSYLLTPPALAPRYFVPASFPRRFRVVSVSRPLRVFGGAIRVASFAAPPSPFLWQKGMPMVKPHCQQWSLRPTSLQRPTVHCLPRPMALPAWHSSAHSASEHQTLP